MVVMSLLVPSQNGRDVWRKQMELGLRFISFFANNLTQNHLWRHTNEIVLPTDVHQRAADFTADP